MNNRLSFFQFYLLLILAITFVSSQAMAENDPQPPGVDSVAPNFTLSELETGRKVTLKDELKNSPVVLVVLRGYPGYQCPVCSRQVGTLILSQKEIAKTGAEVILVYPGLNKGLEAKAKEFFQKHQLPENFTVVTDPDYQFTNRYNLRWDAPRETAYPATFVIKKNGKVASAKISRSHGDRSKPANILKVLKGI